MATVPTSGVACAGLGCSALVVLECEVGRQRLLECSDQKASCVQPSVLAKWRRQRNRTFCGLASLAITLSSLPAGQELDEDEVLPLACKMQTHVPSADFQLPSADAVCKSGMSLAQLHATALFLPLQAARTAPPLPRSDHGEGERELADRGKWQRLHARQDSAAGGARGDAVEESGAVICSVEELRVLLVQTLSRDGRVIANYHMSTLGQTPFGGHHSPIAAYHAPSDSALIMDTWPETEPLWAPLHLLFRALQGLDTQTRAPRGLLLLQV